ncbi:quinone-dependent dihydroorotate dehydrogenase [Basilea psittacipulmonis]|uniref:Dihydroorotate dehydrogenase (quinone) n=1 Tax=Basilea psittacipulmonis DSM 24701 TaxID=1072685 RepID=A0A077DHG3_9BURK|nr:dihydroorotate dehydrogenase [Basilea psittacipulmonis DSM 24701]
MSLFNLYTAIRPLIFSLNPETAHHLALGSANLLANCTYFKNCIRQNCPDTPISLMGLTIKNPIGLAAGLDKNGEYINALALLGFGFIEVGTVTPKPQDGKPQPRLFRIPQAHALINRMGFNNQGLEKFIQNVKQSSFQKDGGILGLNIGKNASTPIEQAIDDYLIGLEGVYPYADYITINISSPNTANLRSLQTGHELVSLLTALTQKREELCDKLGYYKPIVVKIAPDLDNEAIKSIAELLQIHHIDGVIATNTTLDKSRVAQFTHGHEDGGLSGQPVFEKSNEVIRSLRETLGKDYPIIGVGGIMNAQQAVAKLQAGANAIQLYTGLIYQGPTLIKECALAIQKYLAQQTN